MFLSPEQLKDVRLKLSDHQDLIDKIAADPSLATLCARSTARSARPWSGI